jgi:hypothetical protein
MSTKKLITKSKQIVLLFNNETRSFSTRAAFGNSKHLNSIKSNSTARFQSTQSGGSSSQNAGDGKKRPLSNFLKYAISIGLGTTAGLATGYWLMLDQYKAEDANEQTRAADFQATRFVNF